MTPPIKYPALPLGPNTRAGLLLPGLLVLAVTPIGPVWGALELAGILRVATNYDYRGNTRSDNDPTVQLSLDISHDSGLFLGAWLSSVNLGTADIETNPYLGAAFSLSPDWQLGASVAGYFYDGRLMREDIDYGEASLQLHYRELASFTFNVAPDYYGSGHSVLDYEAELRYPMTDVVEVSAGLGYQAGRKVFNYDSLYWNVGIAWYARPWLTLDLRYRDLHEMNERRHDDYYYEPYPDYELDTPVIFSISLGF